MRWGLVVYIVVQEGFFVDKANLKIPYFLIFSSFLEKPFPIN